jgi:hypothetical protein
MLTATLQLNEYTLSIVDGIMSKTTKDGAIVIDVDERNKVYDLFHEIYEAEQEYIRGYFRYYAIRIKQIK